MVPISLRIKNKKKMAVIYKKKNNSDLKRKNLGLLAQVNLNFGFQAP